MTAPQQPVCPAGPEMPERLARTLRHEVGDFLQKVYATVAILQRRLPPDWTQELEVLSRLRTRAEACKHLLDAIQDYLCPLSLACEPVDLADVALTLVAAAREAHPQLEIVADAAGPAVVRADPSRTAQLGQILLTNACEAARRHVTFRTAIRPENGTAEWTVSDDGPGVAADSLERIFSPFVTTRAGHAGLGLALARKVIALHGGAIHAATVSAEDFRVTAVLPLEGPRDDS